MCSKEFKTAQTRGLDFALGFWELISKPSSSLYLLGASGHSREPNNVIYKGGGGGVPTR